MTDMFDPNAKECPHCHGYGSCLTEAADKCTRCHGTGVQADQAARVAELRQAADVERHRRPGPRGDR